MQGRACFRPKKASVCFSRALPPLLRSAMGGCADLAEHVELGLVIALFAWVALNVTLNVFNKWALSPDAGAFSFPIFYSASHMFMGLLSSSLIMAVLPSRRDLAFSQLQKHGGKLLALSTLTVLNITTSNASLVYIGLSVNQIIKSVGPLPALVLTFFVQKKRYSWAICVVVLVLVAGAVLAVPLGDDAQSTHYGVLLASISCVAAASKPVVALLLMRGSATLPPLTLLWYDSFFSLWVMAAVWAVSQEREASISYMKEHTATGLTVLGVGSSVAFLYNLSTFYLTFFTSGLTINVIANTKQVILISISAIVIDHITSVTSWVGVAVFTLALATYTYLTIGPSKARHQWMEGEDPLAPSPSRNGKVGAAGDSVETPEGGGPPASEHTPILKTPSRGGESGRQT